MPAHPHEWRKRLLREDEERARAARRRLVREGLLVAVVLAASFLVISAIEARLDRAVGGF